jgi:hypothetical protein
LVCGRHEHGANSNGVAEDGTLAARPITRVSRRWRKMDTEALQRDVQTLAKLAGAEVLETLAKAADDEESWTKAAADPRSFLKSSGVDVPDRVEILLEDVHVRSDPLPCSAPAQVRVRVPGGRICTRSIQLYIRKPHIQPFPYLKLCVKWGDVPWIDGNCVSINSLRESPVRIG